MFRKLLLALAIAVLPIAGAHALGLGGISLQSRLNEPLDAEIELRSVEPGDLEKLRVGLASSEEFEQAGLDRPFLLASLKFETLQRGDKTVVRVSTRDSFREPFLSFLLKVEWPNGRLLREYTLLLDPPVMARESAPTVQAPVAQAAPQMAPAAPSAPSAPTRAAPMPRAAPAPRVSSVGPGEYRVQRGDNLYTIARQAMADSDVSSQQAMLAFLRANPEAFIDSNINLIKEGYVLRVPSVQEALTVSQAEAVAEVRRQTAEWRTYRQARASGAAQAGAAMAAAPQARLEVVAPEQGEGSGAGEAAEERGAGTDVEAVQKELALATEAAEARRLENDELRDQVADLETKLAEMQRLVTVKVDELAALQARLKAAGEQAPVAEEATAEETPTVATEETAPTEETPTAPTEEQTPTESEQQPKVAEEEAQPDETTEKMAPVAGEEPPIEAVAETDKQPESEPPPPATEPVPQASFQPPEPQPAGPMGFLEDLLGPGIMENPVMLGGIGGGILLLIILLVMALKRRSAAPEAGSEFEAELTEGIEESEVGMDEAEEPSFLDTAADMEVADFEEPAESDQPAESVGGVEQVIAEADVYLAYGRYQQAEELIKGAIEENPGRLDLQGKLLEVHFATRDRDAFESLAQELHSSLESTGGAEWDKYMLMGKDLCPDNPFFAGAETSAASAEESGVPAGALDTGIEFDPFADSATAEPESVSETSAAEAETDLTTALEFDLDETDTNELEEPPATESPETETVVESAAETSDEGALDFDFDFGESDEEALDLEGTLQLGGEPETETPEVEAEAEAESEDQGMDLSLDTMEESSATDETVEDLGLDFDIGEEDGTPSAELSEEDFDLALHTIQTEADAIEKEIEEEDSGETKSESEGEVDAEPSTVEGDASSMMDERDFSIEWDITGMGLEAPEEDVTPTEEVEQEDVTATEDLESTAILDFTSVPLDEESGSEDADMVATKLDLSKAYIDMGDSDGARNILDEVAKEGNETQRQEAESLLSQL